MKQKKKYVKKISQKTLFFFNQVYSPFFFFLLKQQIETADSLPGADFITKCLT